MHLIQCIYQDIPLLSTDDLCQQVLETWAESLHFAGTFLGVTHIHLVSVIESALIETAAVKLLCSQLFRFVVGYEGKPCCYV